MVGRCCRLPVCSGSSGISDATETCPRRSTCWPFTCTTLVLTPMLKDAPPFLWCEVCAAEFCRGDRVGKPLESQSSKPRRINPQLGWIEWRDTRLEPADGRKPVMMTWIGFLPVEGASPPPEPSEADLAPVQTFFHTLEAVDGGPSATTFGDADDPAHTFFTRDRLCEAARQGVWRLYDSCRVRLGRPSFRRMFLRAPSLSLLWQNL